MNEEGKQRYEATMQKYLKTEVSRAQLIKTAGIASLAAIGLPSAVSAYNGSPLEVPDFAQNYTPTTTNGRYTTENTASIFNIAQTAEYFAVTFLTAALNNAATIGLTGLVLDAVQAILAAEITHVQLLTAAGAKPLATTFYVPDPKAISDYTTFFKNVEAADTIFIGAYLAAIREFAEQGQSTLAKVAAQIMGVEAEHRVLARALLALKGDAASVPPNNKAFETDLFVYVSEAAGLLGSLGFLGPNGTAAAFPGLTAAIAATGPAFGQLIQKSPNNAAQGSTTTTNITAEHA